MAAPKRKRGTHCKTSGQKIVEKAHDTTRKQKGKPPKDLRVMSKARWDQLLNLTANGYKRPVAIEEVGVTKATYDAYVIANITAVEQLRKADQTWLRRNWPLERIEEMLVLIAMGKTMKQAGELLFLDHDELAGLYRLLLTDQVLRKLYDEAREMQAEAWADDTIDISDDGTNDTYIAVSKNGEEYEKVNYDNIQRSKLRVESRRWIMARLHHARFGDRIKQDIDSNLTVNHAEQLTKARQRMEKANKQRKKLGAKIPESSITDQPPTKSTH